MTRSSHFIIRRGHRLLRQALNGPQALAFVPALTLAAFWIGGEAWLLLLALGLPLVHVLTGVFSTSAMELDTEDSHMSNTLAALDRALQTARDAAARTGRTTACIMVAVDDMPDVLDRFGPGATDSMMLQLAARMTSFLREGDRVVRLPGGEFGVALAPMRHLDLEIAIQMAGRLQLAVE